MRHVPIAELKDRAFEIVAAAELGEEIVITHHGREVAKLVAVENAEERLAKQRVAIEQMVAFREKLRADGVRISVDELIEWKNEGRR